MNPNQALTLLHEKLTEHGLTQKGWRGDLDTAEKRFGLCSPSRKTITLSRSLVALNSQEEVLDTILHEIAHALAAIETGDNCGHDHRWRAICRRIGAKPERCYDSRDVTTPNASWILAHRHTGEIFARLQKKPAEDIAELFIRGRRKETLGQLELRPLPPEPIEYFEEGAAANVRERILEALKPLAAELGITIQTEKASFTPDVFHLGLKLAIERDDGITAERREFNDLATLFGLSEADYERPLLFEGRTFFLVGFKVRNRKYPIIVRDEQGSRYKLPADALEL